MLNELRLDKYRDVLNKDLIESVEQFYKIMLTIMIPSLCVNSADFCKFYFGDRLKVKLSHTDFKQLQFKLSSNSVHLIELIKLLKFLLNNITECITKNHILDQRGLSKLINDLSQSNSERIFAELSNKFKKQTKISYHDVFENYKNKLGQLEKSYNDLLKKS